MTDKASMTGYAGSAFTTLVGMITLEVAIALIGIVIALAGFVVNSYYKYRQNRREEERHQLELEKGIEALKQLRGIHPEE